MSARPKKSALVNAASSSKTRNPAKKAFPTAQAATRRTVLLAVSGMSPAIITETIWALAKEKPPLIPDEVVVLTTTRGAEDIQSLLLAERPDWKGTSPWTNLRRVILGSKAESDPRLQLSTPRIIEVPDTKKGVKRQAEDLRTPADHSAAADFLLEEVRRLAENPDVRIVSSIAGGRKTMGALLYAAMSLLGRETDRITHVLVAEPFDRCRDFFFPDQAAREIAVPRENRPLCAADAKIELADIPFVPLRNLFERELTRCPGSFSSLVNEASRQLSFKPAKVTVLMDEPVMVIDGTKVRFAPREHVMNILLARRCQKGLPSFADHTETCEDYQKVAEEIRGNADPFTWRDNVGKTEMKFDDMRKILNSIRQKLKKEGGGAIGLERCLNSRNPAFDCDSAIIKID